MLRLLGRPWAFRRVLGMAGGGLRYLLRDEFTTDRAAGAVNGTAAEPGPGTRVVVDTQSKLQIASGELDFISGTGLSDDPRLFYDTAITREAGRLALFDVKSSSNNFWVTFASSVAGAGGYRIWLHDVLHVDNTDGTAIGDNAAALYALILRVSGAMYFSKSSGGQWVLRWLHTTGTTTPLYVGVSQYFTSNNVGFIRVPTAKWLPTPLLSDGFGSAFGTSDGLGHAEGVAGGIGAGGAGVVFSNVGNTWSASAGKAINTPSVGAELITNGSMELDSNWTSQGSPVTNERSVEQVHGGAYSRKLVADSNGDAIGQVVATTVGTWYRVQAYVYLESGDSITIQDYSGGAWVAYNTTVGAWVLLSLTYRASSISATFSLRSFNASAVTAYIDDASYAPLALSSLVSLSATACADVFVGVAITRSSTIVQAGLALSWNSSSAPTNGVIVYFYLTNIYVEKCVAGTWSTVSSTAFTYSAGARLVVVKNGTEYRTYYNNALVKADTITDAGIITNTLHGLFSTDPSNTLDDLTIYATGTGGEYSQLDSY